MDTSAIYATINSAGIQELRFASSSLPSEKEDPAVNNDDEAPDVNPYEEILAVNNLMNGLSTQSNFKQNSSHRKDEEDPAVNTYEEILAVNNYAHQSPRRHWLTRKLGCAGLILVLTLIGISVSVGFLVQKPPRVNMTEPTGRTAILTCLKDWHPYKDKCLFISQTSGSWAEGQDDCSVREATLLLIDNKEELKFIQDFSNRNKMDFFIGLNYVPAEKIWKWINGSILNTDVLQINLKNKENSCASISQEGIFSDACSVYKPWICQKKLKHVGNPMS